MAQPAFRDITDFNLNDPDTVIAKVIEEVAPEGDLLEGKILPQDRQLATRFIERLKRLSAEQWAIIVDTAWTEVRKRPDVLAAMLADIPWVEFSTVGREGRITCGSANRIESLSASPTSDRPRAEAHGSGCGHRGRHNCASVAPGRV